MLFHNSLAPSLRTIPQAPGSMRTFSLYTTPHHTTNILVFGHFASPSISNSVILVKSLCPHSAVRHSAFQLSFRISVLELAISQLRTAKHLWIVWRDNVKRQKTLKDKIEARMSHYLWGKASKFVSTIRYMCFIIALLVWHPFSWYPQFRHCVTSIYYNYFEKGISCTLTYSNFYGFHITEAAVKPTKNFNSLDKI